MLAVLTFAQCTTPDREKKENTMNQGISQETIDKTINDLTAKFGDVIKARAEKGVTRTGSLWRTSDGNADEFNTFCIGKLCSRR